MKFAIDKEVLNARLGVVSHAIPTKSPLPALTGVKIKVESDRVILVASNSNISIRDIILGDKVEIEKTGIALVDGKTFCNIIRVLKGGRVELSSDGVRLYITSGKSKYELNLMNADNYPNIEFDNFGLNTALDMSVKEFSDIVKKVVVSAGTSEKKPILTGVNVACKENIVRFTATDAYRLSKYLLAKECGDFSITIPAYAVNEILKCDTEYEDTKISYNQNKIVFEFGKTTFVTRLLEGNYPDTDRLLANEFTEHLKINREDLINAVDRISIMSPADASDKEIAYNVVKFKVLEGNTVRISVDNSVYGNASETLELANTDAVKTNVDFAFSSKNLITALRSFENEYVTLNYFSDTRPFIITSESEPNLIQLILPVRIN